jgi:RING-H2 zinc finger domain
MDTDRSILGTVINVMVLRRREEENHLGNNTATVTRTSSPSGGNGTGRVVRFAMDLPKRHSHGFKAHSRPDSVVFSKQLLQPRRNSFSWRPQLRRKSAPAKVPSASRKNSHHNDQEMDFFLAANEIERILRDDVHSHDIDQVRLEDDEDDDVYCNNDMAALEQNKEDDHDENNSRRKSFVVSIQRAVTSRNSFTLPSSMYQRLLGSSTLWPRSQTTSTSTTTAPATTATIALHLQPRHAEETPDLGVHDGVDDDERIDDEAEDEEDFTEHYVNAYHLFDSAGADEARLREYQRRQRCRRDEAEMPTNHNETNNDTIKRSPHFFLLSWIIPMSYRSSSLHSHDSAVIYSDKHYDLCLVTHFLALFSRVFVALVILQIMSKLWLLSTSLGIWILLPVLAVGFLVRLWQVAGRLGMFLRSRLEPSMARFRRHVAKNRRTALTTTPSTATAAAATATTGNTTSTNTSSSSANIHQFCSICLEAYCDNEDECSSLFQRQYLVVCKHSFHHHCIQQWLEQSDSCPICRIPTSFASNNSNSPPPPPQHQHYSYVIVHHGPRHLRCGGVGGTGATGPAGHRRSHGIGVEFTS